MVETLICGRSKPHLLTEMAIPIRPIALRGENYLSVQNVTTILAALEMLNTPSVLNIPNRQTSSRWYELNVAVT